MRETVTYKATMFTGPSGIEQLVRTWCAKESQVRYSVYLPQGDLEAQDMKKVYSQDYEVHEAYEQFKCVVASNLNTVYQMMCKVLYIIHL